MAEDRVDRRLAAIFAGDIAGYSRLMGADEEGTLRQLKAHRKELVDPKIVEHRGRIVKTTGDGILVEFVSVVDAVRCAVDIQRGMTERNAEVQADKRIEFRIGINVGDIIIDGDDIFGDGVNVAARLEALADPGGIMVSSNVHDQVRDKLSFDFQDMGEQAVKNISRPVGVHRVHLGDIAQPSRNSASVQATAEKTSSDRPAVAVLPFANMSGDAEQEYFADGITEDIITALSSVRWFNVIARNSTFIYKAKAIDVKRAARELGVRYVLEGSVRKGGNRVRITAQLIDASTGNHIWADRYDGELNDIFELQDQVTSRVVGAIAPKLEQVEIERARRKPTESLDAYDHYLRGMANAHQLTREANEEALRLFYRATELDRSFATAYGMAAWCFVPRKGNGWMRDRASEIAEAERLARRSVDLGADDATALAGGGYALVFVAHDLDSGPALLERSVALNPNLPGTLVNLGWTKAFLGEPDQAIVHIDKARQLSPLDPMSFRTLGAIACAHFVAGRYNDSIQWAEMALRENANFLPALRELAASNALLGRQAEAQAAMDRLRKVNPAMVMGAVKEWLPLRRADDLARLEEGLRKAGLPE